MKKFAELMVTDHTGVNKAAVELVTRLGVTPQDNPTAQSLKAGGEANVTALKQVKGAAFDRAYVEHEVAYHQAVLDAVDKTLLPGASNAELKPQAEAACTTQAARYGAVHVIDVQQKSVAKIIVWGTAGDGAQKQSFECHFGTKITAFKLRPIAPVQ